ncbi:hypothetical protein CANCADRAFT_72821 [Tortispora caseinolytica NRRL Y-17796]|uniref:Phenylacetate 2-hydroxylase n=1 Tax=Tortispora caseinolytica NRRL Y-17796 TaxID=767744 RepID=A0A1E4TIJ0_9ASCO|nr:hypothetical protein CANCADRAFT_72821 [Tortispora caseinolytica NRRL Y-17796]
MILTYTQLAGAAVASFLFYVLVDWLLGLGTDVPRIKGLPEVPGWPIVGNLFQLGENHAVVYKKWAENYGPVFQVRLGNKRVVIANTFESVRKLWIDNQSALISRPMLYTFHKVVSSSQGFTIGTSPWDESCKRRRKTAATALNRPAVQSYMPIIDLESYEAIRDLYASSKNGNGHVDIKPVFQRFALNTSLTLNYGTRLETVDNKMLRDIVETETGISRLRSHTNNYIDYLPFLRFFDFSKKADAKELRLRRDAYLKTLLDKLKAEIKAGTDKPCITGNVIKDPDAKLNEAELKSICLTMVSAGLDTVPANLILGIGHLSQEGYGMRIQQKAYDEIMKAYPGGDAWDRCLEEEKVPYVTALVKETLRHSTVIPMCLPRLSTKPVKYEDAVIPANTMYYMNAYAADNDESYFENPHEFIPERYLDTKNASMGTPHYGYGAGLRMCAGSHLANRELFTAFIRMIVAFEILPPLDPKDAMNPDPMKSNMAPSALVAESAPFLLRLRPRDPAFLESLLEQTKERVSAM